MAALYCSCEQKPQIWGEFWWTGEKHDWIFFDDRETSETYTERITSCRACGQQLERKNLEALTYPAQQPEVRRVGALASHACKEPAAAHYTTYLLDKALEKGLRPSQAFIRGMIQADGAG